MIDQQWDPFTIYVNAYYAVQETYDSARREWERPAEGLEAFCRDANPFLWDNDGSAEPELYESFLSHFQEGSKNNACTASQGWDIAHRWLGSLEGDTYGTSLVESLEMTADEWAWGDACEAVSRQLASRRARIERTPQDDPALVPEPTPKEPTESDIEAVIQLLAKGDEAYAAELRARLDSTD